MTHKIKLLERFCDAVLNGNKTFEVRENDRGYQTGDHVVFVPIDDTWPNREVWHPLRLKEYEITYLLSGFGLKENYVAFSIKEVVKLEKQE